MKSTKNLIAVASALALTASSFGCAASSSDVKEPAASQSGSAVASAAKSTVPVASTQEIASETSSQLMDYNLSELCSKSQLICTGVVTDISNAFYVQSVDENASPMLFQDVSFKVDSVYGGDASLAGSTVTVRVEGGATENVIETNDWDAEFTVGESELLFLYQRYMGEYFNTEGDHYYVVAGKVGEFDVNEDGTFTNPTTDASTTVDELNSLVASTAMETAEERGERLVAEAQAKLKARSSSSDAETAEAELQTYEHYGKVLSEEEAAAVEEAWLANAQ